MSSLLSKLKVPVIVAPMFLVSNTKLVISSCKAGLLGTLPALNARTDAILSDWLISIKSEIQNVPFGINLIVHKTNSRLDSSLKVLVKHKVPLVITSLGANQHVIDQVHDYGGFVFHDVTNITHARKAIKAGVDGLIAVCAGAGGHAGLASPFALIPQLRSEFDGVICAAGAISTGSGIIIMVMVGIRAGMTLGADCAYMGTRFIATNESDAVQAYKEMCVTEKTGPSPTFLPTVYTDKISGVHANFLLQSLINNKIDLGSAEKGKEDFSKLHADGKTSSGKAWKDVWSAGQGIVNQHDIPTVQELADRLLTEFNECKICGAVGQTFKENKTNMRPLVRMPSVEFEEWSQENQALFNWSASTVILPTEQESHCSPPPSSPYHHFEYPMAATIAACYSKDLNDSYQWLDADGNMKVDPSRNMVEIMVRMEWLEKTIDVLRLKQVVGR